MLSRPAELNDRAFVEPIAECETVSKTVFQVAPAIRFLALPLHLDAAARSIAEQRGNFENLGRRRQSECKEKGELQNRMFQACPAPAAWFQSEPDLILPSQARACASCVGRKY